MSKRQARKGSNYKKSNKSKSKQSNTNRNKRTINSKNNNNTTINTLSKANTESLEEMIPSSYRPEMNLNIPNTFDITDNQC